MRVALREYDLDPWQEITSYQADHLESGSFGATSVFVGTMRDFNAGERVSAIDLEHYPGMTEKYLTQIIAEASHRWDMLDALIVHRYGHITPGSPIVVVAVWAAHRGAASDACRFLIEQLKATAPFWKREHTPKGARWVEGNSSGY
jgi:molybdopterin synthase catalytic subunit